ncbi:hypothetical protein AALA98_09325 [Lachnospiraceae bacterium 45-W7]
MTAEEILKYGLENLAGTILVESWGEKGIFYNQTMCESVAFIY